MNLNTTNLHIELVQICQWVNAKMFTISASEKQQYTSTKNYKRRHKNFASLKNIFTLIILSFSLTSDL